MSAELGGKSPVVVFADADPELAVDAALAQIFTMNGQRCTAGSRLLVERPLYHRVVDGGGRARAQDPRRRPVRRANRAGPADHARAPRAGAGLHRLGSRSGRADPRRRRAARRSLRAGNFLQATVIADVDETMRVFQEEIFGPVLVAMPFDDEDEAVRLANATQYGLAAYVWTSDLTRAHRVAHAIDTGMCWINSHNVRDLRTPFGGVKRSGIGLRGRRLRVRLLLRHRDRPRRARRRHIPRLGLGDEGGGAA